MNIYLVFYISLLEKALEGAPPAPIPEIQPVTRTPSTIVEEIPRL